MMASPLTEAEPAEQGRWTHEHRPEMSNYMYDALNTLTNLSNQLAELDKNYLRMKQFELHLEMCQSRSKYLVNLTRDLRKKLWRCLFNDFPSNGSSRTKLSSIQGFPLAIGTHHFVFYISKEKMFD